MGWIYGIRSPKLKEYVGQTTNDDVNVRWNYEKKHPHCVLKSVFEKYGIDKCEFFTIMEISQETHGGDWKDYLNMYEKLYIKERNTLVPNGYNLMTGGENSLHNEKTKKKMSETRMGNTNWLGKTHNDESKQKMSDSQTKKPVEQWDGDVLIKIYPSIMDAEKQTLINIGSISHVCRGIREKAGGYTWKYVPVTI